MKKISPAHILTLALICTLSITSCKQDGCMDPDSKTFNADADRDDGSCKFEGSIVFYYDELTSLLLVDNEISALTYYVDGSIIGSTAAGVYFTSVPSCGSSGSISKTIDLGSNKSKNISYKVVDDLGDVIWEGNFTVKANTCHPLELVP